MKVNIEKIKHGQFGNCIKISNGNIEILASLDFGPRIVSFRRNGGENIFFEDPGRTVKEETKQIKGYYGKDAIWYSYGGHRLWIAPESMPETYYPDCAPVEYQVFQNCVRLIQAPQQENGLQLYMEIIMEEYEGKVEIRHKVKNLRKEIKKIAIWAISVMRPGGEENIPLPKEKTGLIPNVNLSLWPYTRLSDERFQWKDDCITIRQEKFQAETGELALPFKLGINNQETWANYTYKDDQFIKHYEYNPNGRYTDLGVSYETYTNSCFLEMESLSETHQLKQGEEACHIEVWELRKINQTLRK